MSAALAMLVFCNYSEQYSQNRIFDAFFLLIQAASPKKYERMLLIVTLFLHSIQRGLSGCVKSAVALTA